MSNFTTNLLEIEQVQMKTVITINDVNINVLLSIYMENFYIESPLNILCLNLTHVFILIVTFHSQSIIWELRIKFW